MHGDGMGGRATDTTATIVDRTDTGTGTRYAEVAFTTAAGTSAHATIAICHHQSYDIGNAVAIRYDAAAPAKAYEKDMPPRSTSPVSVFAFVAAFGVALTLLAQRKQRRVAAAPAVPLVLAGDRLDAELAALLAAGDATVDADWLPNRGNDAMGLPQRVNSFESAPGETAALGGDGVPVGEAAGGVLAEGAVLEDAPALVSVE